MHDHHEGHEVHEGPYGGICTGKFFVVFVCFVVKDSI